MYMFPFLLISTDTERNRNLAAMFSRKQEENLEKKRHFYELLHVPELEQKLLQNLIFLDHQNGLILIECLRANVVGISGQIQELDKWRLHEKAKRLLQILRKKCYETLNVFDDTEFTNLILQDNIWKLDVNGNHVTWNNEILNRIASVHGHLYNLIDNAEKSVLAKQNVSEIAGKFDLINLDLKCIHEEIKSYLKLIESF